MTTQDTLKRRPGVAQPGLVDAMQRIRQLEAQVDKLDEELNAAWLVIWEHARDIDRHEDGIRTAIGPF